MKMFLRRIKEPSTWAGFAGLISIFNPAAGITVKAVGIAVVSVMAILLPEVKEELKAVI